MENNRDSKKQAEKIKRETSKVDLAGYEKLSLQDDKRECGRGFPVNQKR